MTRFLPMTVLLSTIAFSASVFAAPAMADNYVNEPVTLSYDTTKLASAEEAATVLRSLERQARKVCTSESTVLKRQVIDHDCVGDVLLQAVSGIDSAVLTEIYGVTKDDQTLALNTRSVVPVQK